MPLAFLSGKRLKVLPLFLLFSALSILLRFFSFFPSVIDHDESTYFEIARQILAGKMLYVDYIDIKPPGIFLILAGFQSLFGYSIFVIRLLLSLWIALTALMIYKTGKLLVKNERASMASGIIYIFFVSTWSFYGVSTTPELFFNFFTISALYVLLKKEGTVKYFLAGLIAGLGFTIKYFVLFDFTAFLVFFLFLIPKLQGKQIPFLVILKSILLAGIGFSLPFLLVNIYYYSSGHFEAFFNITYIAPLKYPSRFNPLKMLKFLIEFHLFFLPVFFFFYYRLLDRKFSIAFLWETKKLVGLWLIFGLIAVTLSGNTFGHYTIQLMLPVSLMAGCFFHPESKLPKFLRWATTGKAGMIFFAMLIIIISSLKLEYLLRQDKPREVAAYLKPLLKADDIIYTGNYHHIVYYLLKKDSPTPYLHRSLLTNKGHIRALNINSDSAFNNIIRQKPVYILTEKDYPVIAMREFIAENYILEKDFREGVFLYRFAGE